LYRLAPVRQQALVKQNRHAQRLCRGCQSRYQVVSQPFPSGPPFRLSILPPCNEADLDSGVGVAATISHHNEATIHHNGNSVAATTPHHHHHRHHQEAPRQKKEDEEEEDEEEEEQTHTDEAEAEAEQAKQPCLFSYDTSKSLYKMSELLDLTVASVNALEIQMEREGSERRGRRLKRVAQQIHSGRDTSPSSRSSGGVGVEGGSGSGGSHHHHHHHPHLSDSRCVAVWLTALTQHYLDLSVSYINMKSNLKQMHHTASAAAMMCGEKERLQASQNQRMRELLEENHELSKALSALQEERDQLSRSLSTTITNSNNSRHDRHDEERLCEEEVRQAQQQTHHYKRELAEAKKEAQRQKALRLSWEKEAKKAKEKMEQAERELSSCASSLSNTIRTKLNKHTQELRARLSSSEASRDSTAAQLAHSQRALHRALLQAQKERAEHDKIRTALELRMEMERQGRAEEVHRLKDKISALERERSPPPSSPPSSSPPSSSSSLSSSLSSALSSLAETQTQLAVSQHTNHRYQSEVSSVRHRLAVSEARAQRAIDQLQRATHALHHARHNINVLERDPSHGSDVRNNIIHSHKGLFETSGVCGDDGDDDGGGNDDNGFSTHIRAMLTSPSVGSLPPPALTRR